MAIDFSPTAVQKEMGIQRRRGHGVIARPDFNPLGLMEDEYVEFNKSMETIDTMPAHEMAG